MIPNYITKTEQSFSHLTKGLKKVAKYLINDPIIFAIHPAKKIGSIIGVSETMVIRFCNSIDYNGFSELQDDVRKHMLSLKETSNYKTIDDVSNKFVENIEDDTHLLESNLQNIDVTTFQSIVDSIISSEKVVIAGYYQSFSFAYWLFFNLNYILENAYLYRPEVDGRLLDTMPKKSCLIVFSFYRYSLDSIKIAEETKKRGIKVIAITDSRVSPIVEFADSTVQLNLINESILKKGPITLSIINSILHEVVRQLDKTGIKPTTYKYFINDRMNYDEDDQYY
ncbi:MurR/RpiR family transcriptional regulator [Virgibacillus sp. C22-A2]|uniref:MurR/RpiR family transcriptional regulator n=1 Tax=Virgibacillus tibetensis TaxID=3042313 RepID=A0ABU6KFZ3_9BACI|nr:MurR/RpiR family transcriptional regulator [Virgibacillus sp. C22-A2]